MLSTNDVTGDHAVVQLDVNYPASKPVCTVTSNFVAEAKCDTAMVVWKDLQGVGHTDPIMTCARHPGTEWFFTRQVPSVTRNSAPDIRIVIME